MPLTKEAYRKLNDNTDGVRFIRPFSEYTLQEVIDALNELEELKHYPTADGVCKALSEIEGVCVRYEPSLQAFINEHEHTLVVMMDRGLLLRLYDTYPPHLITLIGRFYEAQQ